VTQGDRGWNAASPKHLQIPAGYVRSHRERWDITAVLEPFQLLGARTGRVDVHLHRSPPGTLAVTIQFELGPAGAVAGGHVTGVRVDLGLPGPRRIKEGDCPAVMT